MKLDDMRTTSDSRLAGSIRLMLAVMFLMTGAMKLLVPMLAEAWAGQLQAAQIPMYEISRLIVPLIEIALGIALAVGIFVRLTTVVVIAIMTVATYVHITVDDPALFPLQPNAPIIPFAVMILCAYLLWRGAGAWSKDLRDMQSGA